LIYFEILGRLQGKAATDAQRFFYGLSGEKLFLEVSSQAEISAMGRISILSLDDGLKYKIYNNLNSFFSQYYSNKNFEFILTYFRNNVRGVFESSYDYTTNLVVESDLCNLEIINNSFKKLSKKEEEIDKYINLKALMSNISLQ